MTTTFLRNAVMFPLKKEFKYNMLLRSLYLQGVAETGAASKFYNLALTKIIIKSAPGLRHFAFLEPDSDPEPHKDYADRNTAQRRFYFLHFTCCF
jgi:hypothetical protein